MNREKKERIILFLLMIIGLCIGMVIGYVFVGYDVERECQKTITSMNEYIGYHCPTPVKVGLEEKLNFNGSLWKWNITN